MNYLFEQKSTDLVNRILTEPNVAVLGRLVDDYIALTNKFINKQPI